MHLVRSQARPTPSPAAGASGAAAAGAGGAGTPPSAANPFGGGAGGAANPFAEMMGSMGGMGGAGGMDINRMQQQLMSNPEMMANIMNSPMMEVCVCTSVFQCFFVLFFFRPFFAVFSFVVGVPLSLLSSLLVWRWYGRRFIFVWLSIFFFACGHILCEQIHTPISSPVKPNNLVRLFCPECRFFLSCWC